jgi:signal transduction histidine kinase
MGLARLNMMNDFETPTKPQVDLSPEILVPRLGDTLVNRGLLSEANLQRALDYQKAQAKVSNPILLGQAIVDLGLLDRSTLDRAVTEQIIMLRQALEEANRTLEKRVQDRTAELEEALRRLAELNQLKANFIANVSHELRTPLTHVKGYVELLISEALGPINEDQSKALEVSQHSVNRLQSLIDNLILFSLASRGELSMRLEPVNIDKVAQDIAANFLPRALDVGIALQVEVESGLPLVQADEQKISWVLSQLLENGIKFTPAGGRVVLAIQRVEQPGMVEISVSDTGIGIPSERFEEVFEPFHQLDGSSTRRYGGTGLGLSLVREILESHNSVIKINSELDKGTTFSFLLLSSEDPKGGQ